MARMNTLGFCLPPDGDKGIFLRSGCGLMAHSKGNTAGKTERCFRRPPDPAMGTVWLRRKKVLDLDGTEMRSFWVPPDGGMDLLAAA